MRCVLDYGNPSGLVALALQVYAQFVIENSPKDGTPNLSVRALELATVFQQSEEELNAALKVIEDRPYQ